MDGLFLVGLILLVLWLLLEGAAEWGLPRVSLLTYPAQATIPTHHPAPHITHTGHGSKICVLLLLPQRFPCPSLNTLHTPLVPFRLGDRAWGPPTEGVGMAVSLLVCMQDGNKLGSLG